MKKPIKTESRMKHGATSPPTPGYRRSMNDDARPMHRKRIVALILVAALLPLAAMVVFATVSARQALEQEILQTAAATARGGALIVDEDIAGKREFLTLFARRRLLNEAHAATARARSGTSRALPRASRISNAPL